MQVSYFSNWSDDKKEIALTSYIKAKLREQGDRGDNVQNMLAELIDVLADKGLLSTADIQRMTRSTDGAELITGTEGTG